MDSRYFRARKMSPIQRIVWQLSSIRNTYSNIESSTRTKNGFTCIMNITPSENSNTYKVEISYRYGFCPEAKLLYPKLEQKNGKYPHHIFNKRDKNGCPYLCVFYEDEWDRETLISQSFIPWVSTWLNTYEFWLITGKWHYAEIINSKEKKTDDGIYSKSN